MTDRSAGTAIRQHPDRLVLDGIIFGLQRFGGISNFWSRLIEATGRSGAFDRPELVMPRTIRAHAMPDMSGFVQRSERLVPQISRYLPVRLPARRGVFHTPYYRVPQRSVDRYVTTVHDFTYERYFRGIARHVHHWQKARSIIAADICICVSQSTRADLLSQFPTVNADRVKVVPLGVDPEEYYPEALAADLAPYVLFVGQRTGYKRFDLAAGAVAQSPELRLVIVGPPLDDAEREMLGRLLPERWQHREGVPNDELRRLYSGAHAFIFPSDYEGFGLPILEAMACGCPVIAANRSSFPEVAGVAALLVDDQAADAYAARLAELEDDDRRLALIEAGLRRAAGFTWESTSSRIWEHYG